jgi:hypothetical protein
MPTLPFKVETFESMQQRFPAAVAEIWIARKEIQRERPGVKRTHVFDGKDGMRLIISRERAENDEQVYIHISASMQPEFEWWTRYGKREVTATDFIKAAERRYRELSGDKRPIADMFLSAGDGVPHLLIKE